MMNEKNETNQAMTNEQYLQELRQRINAKAEKMVKINYTGGPKPSKTVRWILIAVLVAIIVGIEVFFYKESDFWETNAWMAVFVMVCFIGTYLMTLIMRHFLTSMKNASTAPQYYQAVKRLILTHQLRYLAPLVMAWGAADLVTHRLDFEQLWPRVIECTASVIGVAIGASMRNWNLDEDFRYDVEELRDLIKQESAN